MYQTRQDYKYQLDNSSRKYICPRCGKKSFVLYLDEDGNPLDNEVGKCDRKDNCNWHYTPKQYFQDREQINTSTRHIKSQTKMSRPKVIPPSFINPQDFISTLKGSEHNSLMQYLHSVFDNLIGSDEVDRIAMLHGVGSSKEFGGSPVFWQIDENGRIRTGKIMGYDPITGKRIKEPKPQIQWVHSLMKEQYPGFKLQQAFFGSHLIINAEKQASITNAQYKTLCCNTEVKPYVALFESEKACLIVAMALAWGNCDLFVPISCGGCEGFNPVDSKKRDPYDAVRLLKGRRVVIFPDEGKHTEWMGKAKLLVGFSSDVYVSKVMETTDYNGKQKGDGFDDIILSYIRDGNLDAIPGLLNSSFTLNDNLNK